MPRWLPDFRRCTAPWLAASVLLALTPKCFFCLLAYAGLGSALGLGAPEICGAPAGTWSRTWIVGLAAASAAAGLVFFFMARRLPRSAAASGR